jgi:hypothetical protein
VGKQSIPEPGIFQASEFQGLEAAAARECHRSERSRPPHGYIPWSATRGARSGRAIPRDRNCQFMNHQFMHWPFMGQAFTKPVITHCGLTTQ